MLQTDITELPNIYIRNYIYYVAAEYIGRWRENLIR